MSIATDWFATLHRTYQRQLLLERSDATPAGHPAKNLRAHLLRRVLTLPRRRPRRSGKQQRRTIDPTFALNRKNALFAGSDEGGEN